MTYRYRTTVMRRTSHIHERQLIGEQYDSKNQPDKKNFFHMTPGGGKSLGQKVLRPQPKPKAASVKIQGGGITCCHAYKQHNHRICDFGPAYIRPERILI